MRLPRRSAVIVLLASTFVAVGTMPASAHCSLGPFDAAIRYSDSVWAGEIVAGKRIDDDRTPFQLTLRVDEVLSGANPGPEAQILAQPCKQLNGVAPSTIEDYVGITGVFAIADVPTGFFYVETFRPEGDPVAAARAVLATDPFASPSASAAIAPPSPAPLEVDGGSSAIPYVVSALGVLAVGFALVVRSQSRRSARKPPEKRPSPTRVPGKNKGKTKGGKTGPVKKRPSTTGR
jgi:hypothetical protein